MEPKKETNSTVFQQFLFEQFISVVRGGRKFFIYKATIQALLNCIGLTDTPWAFILSNVIFIIFFQMILMNQTVRYEILVYCLSFMFQGIITELILKKEFQ